MEGSDEDMPLWQAWLIVSLLFASIGVPSYYCCGCCIPCCCFQRCRRKKPASSSEAETRKEPDTVRVNGDHLKLDHLRQRKELTTAYLLWAGAGLLGAHHFYLDRMVQGALAIVTMNFLTLGWIVDALALPVYVRSFNAQTARVATTDRSCRRICWRLPVAFIIWSIVFLGGYLKMPRLIHDAGIVDIDAAMAETASNPYGMLGISPDSSKRAAVEAFQRETLRLQRECAQLSAKTKCKDQQRELQKAYDFVKSRPAYRDAFDKVKRSAEAGKKRNGGRPRDERDDYIDAIGLEWKTLWNIANKKVQPFYKSFRTWTDSSSEESSPTNDGSEDDNSDL